MKHKLYIPIINMLFPVMSKISDEEEDDEIELAESLAPAMIACQTLDVLAINLPPEKFMSALLVHVQPALQNNDDPQKMKGKQVKWKMAE